MRVLRNIEITRLCPPDQRIDQRASRSRASSRRTAATRSNAIYASTCRAAGGGHKCVCAVVPHGPVARSKSGGIYSALTRSRRRARRGGPGQHRRSPDPLSPAPSRSASHSHQYEPPGNSPPTAAAPPLPELRKTRIWRRTGLSSSAHAFFMISEATISGYLSVMPATLSSSAR
jgi:hypothetical protein